MIEDEKFKTWTSIHKAESEKGANLMWPSETLVRLFKGSYVPSSDKNYNGKKVLDIGFGNGNNLCFLSTLGLSLYGTEVSEEICEITRKTMAQLGSNCNLQVGTNRNLPFSDNEFDYLVSWNVIHYEDTEEKIRQAIKEYHRVLKPNGRFYISTTGPEHLILKDSKIIGAHRYLIGREGDFRKGQVFFYFDSPEYIHYYFSELFKDVLVGRTHDFLMTETLDWFIITGVK